MLTTSEHADGMPGSPPPPPLPLPALATRRRFRALLGARAYVKRASGRCFICATVTDDPDYPHHLVHRDDVAIAFLAKDPPLWGHVLVAPTAHREHVTGDFGEDEYVALQRVVHRVGNAVRRAVPCDRLSVLSLGSQQLNRHVHWHIAPLPTGVRLPLQQFRAFSQVFTGTIVCPPADWEALAARIRGELRVDERPS
jgi:diadenosine tetraphosphate (Ap4A) HIT family hydrolase